MSYQVSKMRLTLRRILQALFLALLFSFSTLAMLRTFAATSSRSATMMEHASAIKEEPPWIKTFVGFWPDRSLRSVFDEEGKEFTATVVDDNAIEFERAISTTTSTTTTATSKPQTSLDDIFISVKTTKNFHATRLDVIIKTWFTLAREQTWFFTDSDDEEYSEKTHNHLINTGCSASHNRMALCCKMAVEFDTFLESNKRWFCHFDDDNYVNVPQLVRMLQKHDWTDDWYLGKPSIKAPLEILDREHMPQKISFWFATGGAGFCLSRSLGLKMKPLASGGKFISIGDKIRLPDDVTMGYIVEHLLSKQLTVVEEFHSHLEPMKFLKQSHLAEQITFSYSHYGPEMNVLSLNGFNNQIDPYRFLSLHCNLYPNFSFCPR
ncbi:Beta-1,3-N-acetylglucosaminyltransferase radical fringe [Daphnia magna]|uniref:Beta-1,3-N-acetylglucosaminyltransferase radical fringe n=1 Tax=Daphnia magna TaxID=35525 RepID=A0A0P5SJE9_9CRUS|nr:Beta-1,3-N-acetylglucosaminyltransferase radical fringe [Daphnia magna]